MAVTINIMYDALLGLGKISIIWRPLFSHCVSLQMLSTLNTFYGRAFHSSSFLIFLLLVPLVWCVEWLYCCDPPSLGIVLSLFTSSELHLSSSPPLNRLSSFAVKVQPHLSLYSWWLIIWDLRGSNCCCISSISMINTDRLHLCCKPLTAWIN